jgi:hypothetical protein
MAMLAISPGAGAQNSFGSIVGTVVDTSGAQVPGAEVSVKNLGTNATVTTKTSSSGTYSVLNLNPGTYTVTFSMNGFKTTTRNQVDVTVGGTLRVDAALQLGEVSETVNVEAAAAPLQTDSSSLGGVVEGRQVLESPLNGRNVNNLLDFVPGVVPGGGTAGNTVANGGSGSFQVGTQTQAIAYGNYQIGGGFSGQSLFFIDGVESNIPENNVNSLVPTQDSVQEFRVSTNNATAEFGGYSGGVVQIATKQGTNDFHGSVYEYFRNTVLDANDFFDNHFGNKRQPLHQNQYGVNVGGPLRKNTLFFFFSFEREPVTSGGLDTFTVPTAAQRNGNFSAFTAAAVTAQNPGGQILFNPATGAPYTCNGVANVICPALLDPTAQKLLNLEYPLPNVPGLANGTVNNFVGSAPITGAQNQFDARVDFTLRKADQLFAKYTFWNPHNGDSDPEGTKTGAGPTGNTTTEAVVGDNHTFNSTTIADIRLSWLENYNFQVPLSNGFDQSTINANYGALQAEQVNHHQGLLPGLGFQNYSGGAELSQLYWLNTAYSINGSITKVKGRHTIKVGGQGRQILWTGFGNNQGLGLSDNNSFTACPVSPTCPVALNANSGNAIASFLLGVPSSTGITEVNTTRAFLHSYGFYGVDTWQVSNKLTLNLGARWEQPGSYSEVNNLDTVLLPGLATSLPSFTNPITGASQPTVGGLALVDSPQYPSRREETLHWKLFSPREGFDYRVNSNTVIRGGYGVNFLPAEFTADGPGGSPINAAGTGLSNTPGVSYAGEPTVANPLPNGINQPLGRNPIALTQLLGQGIGSRIPNQPYGYVQQFNIGTEHAFGPKTTLSVAYAGSKGTHLVLSQGYTGTGLNLDQMPDQYDSIGGNPSADTGLFKLVTNPYAGKLNSGVLNQPTIFEGYLLRPFPQYTGVGQTTPRYGASSYNALQVSFTQRFSHGGLIQAAYTYARLMSNTDNTSSFEDGQGGQGVVQDNTNIHPDWSDSLQDLTHNLVINYGLDLPFGHGQQYLNGSNALLNALVGGWRLNGITTLHSGLPVPFSSGETNYLGYFGAGPIRPNVIPGCDKNVGGPQQSRLDGWFNVTPGTTYTDQKGCFYAPGQFSFGDESRVDGQIRSSGAANWDLSVNKVFKAFDRVTGKASLEAFNLFNRTQFGSPDSNLADAAFGSVTSQRNLPRVLQVALRFSF